MNKIQLISLHQLEKITKRSKKRVGRGYGSGKGGHTSGRGQKGQRSRRTIQWWFEGGQLPLVRRVPFLRGKGRLNPLKQKPIIIKTGQFNKLKSGSTVKIDTLIHERMVSEADVKVRGVKILAGGKLEKKLTVVGIPTSAGARKEIEGAGGKADIETKDRVKLPLLRKNVMLQKAKKPMIKKTIDKKIKKPKTRKREV